MSLNEQKNKEFSLVCKITGVKKITNIIILKDGRLSSCTKDGELIIYKKRNYSIEDSIKEEKSSLYYHIQLSNTNIVTCGKKDYIHIYKLGNNNKYELFQKFEAYENRAYVYKVIEFDDFLITSNDSLVKLWKKNENNEYIQFRVLRVQKSYSDPVNILRLNNNKLLCSAPTQKHIVFYQIKDNIKAVGFMENLELNKRPNLICMVNDNILFVAKRENGMYLIDIHKYEIIANIFRICKLYSVIRLRNGNILIGCDGWEDRMERNSVIECKYESDNKNNYLLKVSETDKAHKKKVNCLIEMKNGTIITCSYDKTMKFWKRK